jgi:hypothetical protein
VYLHRYFRFYVPGTNRGVLDPKAQQGWAEEVMQQFAVWFGGATVTNGKGAWMAGNGKLVTEPVVLVESFTSEELYQQHNAEVYALAGEVAKALGQESVALEDCGRLFLIEPIADDAQEQKLAA